jgi:hypothetical protein
VFVPAGAILALLLAARLAYYGALFPNTYQVKGAHASFEIGKLAALWKQGAPPLEVLAFTGGALLLAAYGVRRRAVAAPVILVACLYFTASVAVDWMPSIRHLLPVTVLAPIGWACFAAEIRSAGKELAAALVGATLASGWIATARIDVRLSPIEHRERWVVRKNREKWADTLRAYRKEEPPHVTAMDAYEMGQVTQVWGVLETSDAPVDRSWFAGRDIGIVGYGTDVRIFDTAGLVTREVSRDEAWARRGEVTDALVRRMIATRPVAGEVYDGWDAALGRDPRLLTGYRIRNGPVEAPIAFIATDRKPPPHDEVVRRYRAFAARLPRLYHLHTLYGEAVGAAVERRVRIVVTGRP